MSAAAKAEKPSPKLTLAEAAAMQMELADPAITPARRAEISKALAETMQQEEVARMSEGRMPWNEVLQNLCRDVLAEDETRVRAAVAAARDEARRAREEERRQHLAGRPARFAALPAMDQALLVAESCATTPGAGFRALREALNQQAAGEALEVPWTFETELLPLGKLRELAGKGLIDGDVLEQAERRERAVW